MRERGEGTGGEREDELGILPDTKENSGMIRKREPWHKPHATWVPGRSSFGLSLLPCCVKWEEKGKTLTGEQKLPPQSRLYTHPPLAPWPPTGVGVG